MDEYNYNVSVDEYIYNVTVDEYIYNVSVDEYIYNVTVDEYIYNEYIYKVAMGNSTFVGNISCAALTVCELTCLRGGGVGAHEHCIFVNYVALHLSEW